MKTQEYEHMSHNPMPLAEIATTWQAAQGIRPRPNGNEPHLNEEQREASLRAEWLAERTGNRVRTCEALIPARFRRAALTEARVTAWCDSLVSLGVDHTTAVHGPSLLLLGATGRGKTHQAFGVVRYLVAAGLPNTIAVVTAVDLYASLRPRPGTDFDSEAVFARYAEVGLLVLDDLGAAKSSEWVEEINYRLINHRYNHELPTVLTSNVPPKDLATALGERVTSRLMEMTTTVVLRGSDRRRAA